MDKKEKETSKEPTSKQASKESKNSVKIFNKQARK